MIRKNVRLSKNVIPVEYDILLRPDLENFTFEGVETITLSFLKQTKSFTLHSKELKIETAGITIESAKVFANQITYDTKTETAHFIFPQFIPVGKTKLTVVFKGILNNQMRGFYKSSYHIDGKIHHLATTQFEATDARRAFPCFDEPAHKAVFHVSLVVPNGKTAISNTLPISIKEHSAGLEIVRFSPTPKMSTYLLAFIVGDFECVESKTNKGVLVRVFTTPGKKHQASFALDCAVKTLEFYEDYFAIPYPLPVLDLIAIPDFASGAMENWGAITYRESALLVDPDHSSISTKQWVALVIAHEIAHQWFGNLVTMEWWTHLWLNEGFASYIEYLAVDKLFPSWDIWTQFSTHSTGVALRLDALRNTHPIEITVHNPDEIGEIFDEVSYSKGACIIKMLADYLSENTFREGLRYYLKKHSYKNTETIHLWEAFEKISRKPIGRLMREWTRKSGYPVIKADIEDRQLTLSQTRFFASSISIARNKDKTVWQTPISIETNVLQNKVFLAHKKLTISASLINLPKTGWIKINAGESGFFRTAYSKKLLERLKTPIRKKTLSARDRLGVVRDLFALAEAGVIPTNDTLLFLESYQNEDNYTVWVELATGLARLEQLLAKTPEKENLNKFILKLFSPLAVQLGWEKKESDIHSDTFLRSLAISRAGRSGDKKIITEAKKKLKNIQNSNHVNPDIRGAIYNIIATHGGINEYKKFIKQYKAESLHEEKDRIGNALGNFPDPKILKLVCEFAISDTVRPQDTVGIISSVAYNPMGRDIWFGFIKKNWAMLVSRYGDGGHMLAPLIKAMSGTPEKKHLITFKKFFTTHPAPSATRAVQQVIEKIEGNIAWLKKDEKAIKKFLWNI